MTFSPNGQSTAAIAAEIAKAKTSVHVMIYELTSPGLATELIAAKTRGCDVTVVADKINRTPTASQIPALAAAGVKVLIDDTVPIEHNKVVIIDADTVITGSMNWTAAGQTLNAENTVIIRDPATAHQYEQNFARRLAAKHPVSGPCSTHRRHSRPAAPTSTPPVGTAS